MHDHTTDYQVEAEKVLLSIERQVDAINEKTNLDIDIARSGSLLNLVFRNRVQLVINLQAPLEEIWLASPAGGFHFRLSRANASSTKAWLDTKSAEEFFAVLSRLASLAAGAPLVFSASLEV